MRIKKNTEHVTVTEPSGSAGQTSEPAYSLVQIDNPDFIHIRLGGLWSDETGNDLVREIIRIVDASDLRCALIDCRDQVTQSTVSFDFFCIKALASSRIGRLSKIALVGPRDHKERIEFMELVARNRYVNLRGFYTEDDARTWILKNGHSSRMTK